MGNSYKPNTYMGKTREEVALEHAPLVRKIANRLAARLPSRLNRDDLFQAGMVGLLDALDKYQSGKDAQFRTYAEFRIKGSMLDDLRASDWVPRSVRDVADQLGQAERSTSARLGRPATEDEIAAEMGLDLRRYHKLLMKARSATLLFLEDLHPASASEDSGNILDILPDPQGQNPQEALELDEVKAQLAERIAGLPKNEQLALSLYYEKGLNLREIGLVMNLTESRICQLRSQAIVRLRASLKAEVSPDVIAQILAEL